MNSEIQQEKDVVYMSRKEIVIDLTIILSISIGATLSLIIMVLDGLMSIDVGHLLIFPALLFGSGLILLHKRIRNTYYIKCEKNICPHCNLKVSYKHLGNNECECKIDWYNIGFFREKWIGRMGDLI